MKLHEFIKNVSDTKLHGLINNASEFYFSQREIAWKNSKRFWSFWFIAFFSLYLFQIYSAYINISLITDSNWINPDEIWKFKVDAVKIQGIVLAGIFIRFLSSLFRGNWAIRFGEVGEFIAFFAFCNHAFGINSNVDACSQPYLVGMTWTGNWIGLFFFSWFFYKISWAIAVIWEIIRK